MNDKIIYQFELFCKKADYACKKNYGTTELEPYLLSILEFTKKNIKYKNELVHCFINLVNDGHYGPYEIIVFCMRELQWEEILNAAIQRHITNQDPRVKSVMNDIIEVYDPDWDDYDLYLYYSGNTARNFIPIREKIKDFLKSKVNDIKILDKLLLEMLSFAKKNITDKDQLIKCFSDLIFCYQLGSYEIITYCMRELQWPEIKKEIISKLDRTEDKKTKSELQDMLTVYGPHWKDANLYEYYKNK